MKREVLASEIQNYIEAIQEQRSRSEWLSYDVCQKILEYATENKSDILLGLGYYYLAENYWYHEDNEQIMGCLTECAKYFQTAEMHEYIARTYNMMGAVSDRLSSHMAALGYYYSALQYAEKYGFCYTQALAENNIAYSLVRMKMHKEAIERYNHAIACYRQSEETYHSRSNQLICMIECGICHLVTGETQEVLALGQQIIEFLKEHSEISYVSESLWLYFAACEKIRGNVNRAGELMDKILVSLQEEEAVRKFIKHIMFLAAFLGEEQDDDRLGRLMDIVQKGVVEQYISIYLDCYPFLEAYLLRVGRITEYVQYTKKYFSLYERHVKENYKVTAMMLELRDKLESVKTQQDNIRAYNRQLESIAMHDSMTGLANRTYLNEYLAGKFERAFLQQELLGVELMDIDCFKQYNDTYGHLAGDKCIEAIADVLHSIQNEKIFCARYGGDEFVLVYSGMDLEGIRQTAKKIQERVRELVIPHIYNLCARHVTVSQGIFARIPMEENREWDFNAMADKALYEAKNVGRNCFCVRTEFE